MFLHICYVNKEKIIIIIQIKIIIIIILKDYFHRSERSSIKWIYYVIIMLPKIPKGCGKISLTFSVFLNDYFLKDFKKIIKTFLSSLMLKFKK